MAFKWTVKEPFLNQDPDYICYHWMKLEPDYLLLKTIESVYNIQLAYNVPAAGDLLCCYRAVHDIITSRPADGAPVGVWKRARDEDAGPSKPKRSCV